MKIEKLSSSKVKVTLTPSDFDGLNITPAAISPDSPELRRLVICIIQKAETETDFSTLGGDIRVEAMADNENFVFVISKIVKKTPARVRAQVRRVSKASVMQTKPEPMPKKQPGPKSVPEFYPQNAIYVFESFDMFLSMMSAISDTSVLCDTTLYKLDGSYQLKIPYTSKNMFLLTMLANEFAVRQTDFLAEEHLCEYGKIVATADDFYKIENSFILN